MGAVGAEALLPIALGALPGFLGSAGPDRAGSSRLAGVDVSGGTALLARVPADPRGAVSAAEVEGVGRKPCDASQQLQKPPPAPHVLYHQGSRVVP